MEASFGVCVLYVICGGVLDSNGRYCPVSISVEESPSFQTKSTNIKTNFLHTKIGA